MTEQQNDLFAMSRNTDPETSHQAALEHALTTLSERRRQVFDLVNDFPGQTAGELARIMLRRFGHLPITVCAETPHKRLPELERLGLVRRGDARECGDSGYDRMTWWPHE